MSVKAILFDLDGTLLPMDQDAFTKGYFQLLAQKAVPLGYDPAKMVDTVWAGTAAMVRNDGSCSNEAAFWRKFAQLLGQDSLKDRPMFDQFYREEFQQTQAFCGFNPQAAQVIRQVRSQGLRPVLATNPLFPAVATHSRIRWAGLEPSDFELCTTYENIGFCKPNPAYYLEIARRIGLSPAECLMVGNDVGEDMIAETIGMQVFLLTDCLLNREGRDISAWPHGGFDALSSFLAQLPSA